MAERAYIFITNVNQSQSVRTVEDLGDKFYGDYTKMVIDVEIKNYGRTPAIITENWMKVQYAVKFPEGALEPISLKIIPPNIVIASGKPFIHTSEIKIPNNEWAAIGRGESQFRCLGQIEYKDIFKKDHKTWFTWYWDHRLRCFKISNFEYNNGYD
jgi:hypothetical protein